MGKYFSEREFNERFPSSDECLEEIKQLRFGNDIDCPKCVRQNKFYRVKGRSAYACSYCGHHIYPLKGSIFDHSATPLKTWFKAIYYMAQTRSGVSAKTLERTCEVTYKTAWRMMHQIRKLMAEDGMPLFGVLETDTMTMHPDPQKRSTVKGYGGQTVFGILERHGRAKVKHVKSAGERILIPEIRNSVAPASMIYTDTARAYDKLDLWGYRHESVNHSIREYVREEVSTQSIENLWSRIKPSIKGVYRHVSPQHLQGYLDEYSFRYSYRRYPKYMFDLILSNIAR